MRIGRGYFPNLEMEEESIGLGIHGNGGGGGGGGVKPGISQSQYDAMVRDRNNWMNQYNHKSGQYNSLQSQYGSLQNQYGSLQNQYNTSQTNLQNTQGQLAGAEDRLGTYREGGPVTGENGYGEAKQAQDYNASTYDAEYAVVDQDTDTVEGRLAGLLDKGSPLMQRAETKAMQKANQRGLMNSSMAVGAAQNAVIDAALPIATTDAGFMNQQRLTNQQAENTSRQFNTQQQNAFDSAEQAQNYQQQNMQLESELNQLLKQQGYQQQVALAELEDQFKRGQLDATVYANTKGEYLSSMMDLVKNSAINISEIQKANNIKQADKNAMVQQQIQMRDADIRFLQQMYASTPVWNQNWSKYASVYSR